MAFAKKILLLALALCFLLLGSQAQVTITPTSIPLAPNNVTDFVLPCGTNYYVTPILQAPNPADYLFIQLNITNNPGNNQLTLYAAPDEIATAENFVVLCNQDNCSDGIYITCPFDQGGSWYITVQGNVESQVNYTMLFRRTSGPAVVSVSAVGVEYDFSEHHVSSVSQQDPYADEAPFQYDYYSFVLAEGAPPGWSLGTYLQVVLFNAEANETGVAPSLFLNLNGIANGEGCTWDHCLVDGTKTACTCDAIPPEDMSSNATSCNVTTDPCYTVPGTYYFAVRLPSSPMVFLNYSVQVNVYNVLIIELEKNTPYYYGNATTQVPANFHLHIDPNDITAGQTRLRVKVSSIVGGSVGLFVQKDVLAGNDDSESGGNLQGCEGSIAFCESRWSCNVVLEKCFLEVNAEAGADYYFAVGVLSVDDSNPNTESDQVTFVITAYLENDPDPIPLTPNPLAPVIGSVHEAEYVFYRIDVPKTVDTWLFVELYANEKDTEVVMYMLSGALPGGDCYAEPDFVCLTGYPRESCQFTVQSCHLQQGPLYIAVYGHHNGYPKFGTSNYHNNTYYDYPVRYTLWADYEVATAVSSGVSFSDQVYNGTYNHYYIVAYDVAEGEYLTVEFSNIRNGNIQGFVNFQYLAGACPCYANMYNCSTADDLCPYREASIAPYTENDFCTIWVPPCVFKTGVWYISSYGFQSDSYGPVGYTLTATIWKAPTIHKVALGSTTTATVAYKDYNHYKLIGFPPSNNVEKSKSNLVVKLNYVTNITDISSDSLVLRLKKNSVATKECYDYECHADYGSLSNGAGYSYCTIVVPFCEWVDGEWYISVYGNSETCCDQDPRYTLEVTTEQFPVTALESGVPAFGRVYEYRYQHYYIDVTKTTSNYLVVEYWPNWDQSLEDDVGVGTTLYMAIGSPAGDEPCYEYADACNFNNQTCTFMIENCDLVSGRYYFSVYGAGHQFYDQGVEYTLLATLSDSPQQLSYDVPVMAYLYNQSALHYSFEVTQAMINNLQSVVATVANVQYGSVQAYLNYGSLAGPCPCYSNIDTNTCDSTGTNYCQFNLNFCELVAGTYYLSVFALDNTDTGLIITDSVAPPIGVTIEVTTEYLNLTDPAPFGVKFPASAVNNVWSIFRFSIPTQLDHPYMVVNISNIQGGQLEAFIIDSDGSTVDCASSSVSVCGVSSLECITNVPICSFPTNTFYLVVSASQSGVMPVTFDLWVYQQAPTTLTLGSQIQANLTDGLWTEYALTLSNVASTAWLQLVFNNITESPFSVYINQGTPNDNSFGYAWSSGGEACCANNLPATITGTCAATGDASCTVSLYNCDLSAGTYYITVMPAPGKANFTLQPILTYTTQVSGGSPQITALSLGTTSNSFTLADKDSWMTFSVTPSIPAGSRGRLVIQTDFEGSSAAAVFYQAGFPPSPSCYDDLCNNGDDCYNTKKFVVDVCCTESTTYYVAVNLKEESDSFSFSFLPRLEIEPSLTTLSLGTPASGSVQGEMTANFAVSLPADVQSSYATLIVNVTSVEGSITAYVREGAYAGPDDTGCYRNVQSCSVSGNGDETDACTISVYYCALVPSSTYYIGVHNNAFSTDGGDTIAVANFTVTASLRLPQQVSLNTNTEFTVWGAQTYQQYYFTLSQAVLGLEGTPELTVEVTDGAAVTAYLYSAPAGDEDATGCLQSLTQPTTCTTDDTCSFPLSQCSGSQPGTYYLGILVGSGDAFSTFNITVNTTSTIDYRAISGSNGRFTTTYEAWNNDADATHYWSIDTTSLAYKPGTYMTILLTDVAGGDTSLKVLSACCGSVSISCSAGADCYVDQAPLTPCSYQPAVYYVQVDASGITNYTLVAQVFQPSNAEPYELVDGVVNLNYLFAHEYYTYYFDGFGVGQGGELDIWMNVTCGQMEAWLNRDTTAGPECVLELSSEALADITECGSGIECGHIHLDACDFTPAYYYVTVHATSQEYNNDVYDLQVKYTIMAKATYYNFTTISLDCPAYFDTALGEVGEQQFVLNIETLNLGAYLAVELDISTAEPAVEFDEWSSSGLVIRRNAAVGLSCSAEAYCTLEGIDRTCVAFISPCDLQLGQYFISVFAPNGSTVTPYLVEGYVPEAPLNTEWRGTVGVGFYQYYRLDLSGTADPEFVLTVQALNVTDGTILLALREGIEPWSRYYTPGEGNDFYDSCVNYTCTVTGCLSNDTACIDEGNNQCTLRMDSCREASVIWFITVAGVNTSASCNTSIGYTLLVTTTVPVDTLPVPYNNCQTVQHAEYHHYHLSPAAKPTIESILHVEVADVVGGDSTMLYILDGHVVNASCENASCSDDCSIDVPCMYTNMYAAVEGVFSSGHSDPDDPDTINYRLITYTTEVTAVALTSGVPVLHAEYNDTCLQADVVYYKIAVPAGTNVAESYLQVVLSPVEGYTATATAWLMYNSLPWPGHSNCYLSTCSIAGSSDCAMYVTCGLAVGTYYIEVQAASPYVIEATLFTNVAQPLPSTPTAVSLSEDSPFAVYYVDVPATFTANNYLYAMVQGINYVKSTAGGVALWSFGSLASYYDSECVENSTLFGSDATLFGTVEVNSCHVVAGRWYLSLQWNNTYFVSCQNPTMLVSGGLLSNSLTAEALTNSVAYRDTVAPGVYNHYSLTSPATASNVAVLHVKTNVTGGQVTVYANPRYYAAPFQDNDSPCDVGSCTISDNQVSCAFYVDTCTYNRGTGAFTWYLSVQGVSADCLTDYVVTYDLTAAVTEWTALSNTPIQASFANDNWEYDFYMVSGVSKQSLSVEVQVTAGDGVEVVVMDSPCEEEALFYKQIYCSRLYTQDVACQVEVSTKAAHSGADTFYVTVLGNNATYSISALKGTQNCAVPQGLQFCSGLVTYSAWQWTSDATGNRDNAAECLYNDWREQFYCRDCYCGLTPECESALKRLACYYTFGACDANGFVTGVCSTNCDAVAYYCGNWFDSVELGYLNCTSHQWQDKSAGTCTGSTTTLPKSSRSSRLDDRTVVLREEEPLPLPDTKNGGATLYGFTIVFILPLVLAMLH